MFTTFEWIAIIALAVIALGVFLIGLALFSFVNASMVRTMNEAQSEVRSQLERTVTYWATNKVLDGGEAIFSKLIKGAFNKLRNIEFSAELVEESQQ